jgi:hypothetical protein
VPPDEIAALMNAALPRWFWVFLGVAEVAAAFGITLPGAARIMPWLVPAAAGGMVIVMISATIWHVVRGEFSSAVITLVLLIISTYVAYMRGRINPIPARSATVSRA